MKIIFLDIDGVLNNNQFIQSYNGDPDFLIMKSKIDILNRIISVTGSDCVLSSDWRFTFSADRMQKHLYYFGFIGKIIDCTDIDYNSRLDQILNWVDRNPVTDFVVIDDLDVFNLDIEDAPKHHHDLSFKHMFRTDDNIGLTDDIADKIIARLNS